MNYKDNNNFFEASNWDIAEPILGHEQRFLQKLNKKHPKKSKLSLQLVASIVFALGTVSTFFIINQKTNVELSPQTQQTEDYFASVISKELHILKVKENPKNKKIINDALQQLAILENDYDLLKKEVAKNGENKQIIHALLTNMQTRISFIQSVLEQIENINQLKNNQNENTI
jgi:hypothetical protein